MIWNCHTKSTFDNETYTRLFHKHAKLTILASEAFAIGIKNRKWAAKYDLIWEKNWRRLGFQSDVLLTKLTWHVLIRGSLNCLVHLTFWPFWNPNELARINEIWLYKDQTETHQVASQSSILTAGKMLWLEFFYPVVKEAFDVKNANFV